MTEHENHEGEQGDEASAELVCLGGRPAPEFLGDDMALLLSLPEDAQRAFWEVLGPCLSEPLDQNIDRIIDSFAKRYDVRGSEIARALRSARLLVLEAARGNAEKHVLAADITTIAGENAERLRSILLEGYEDVRQKLRAEIVSKSITDYGRLLLGMDWRIDQIATSQRGLVDTPIALLTLTFQEGEERKRLTLHAELPVLEALQKSLAEAVRS